MSRGATEEYIRGLEEKVKEQTKQLELARRDIAEQKRLSEQLLQSEKMVTLRRLVGDIAHELNNPLAVVIGYAELLTIKKLDEETDRRLKTIIDHSERAAKIVRDLLTFARQSKPKKYPVDINEIVRVIIDMRSHELKANNIRSVIELSSDLPLFKGDYQQLQEVFNNIIINAEQAIHEVKRPGEIRVSSSFDPASSFITVKISDNGPGIPQENIRRIFDPFFTTKGVGKGTGLGLSTAYGIIREHEGTIYAESVVGEGATFIVELPTTKPVDEELKLA